MKSYAVVLAGGTGSRVGKGTPKQFLLINGKEILVYSLEAFSYCKEIDEIILVSHPDYVKQCEELISKYNIGKVVAIVDGGETRQDSVKNGVMKVKSFESGDAIVLVHDSARPLVKESIIKDNIKAVKEHGSSTTAIPVVDSVYIVENNEVNSCLDRSRIFLAQTPQCALLSLFIKAYEKCKSVYSDEAGLLSCIGVKPKIVFGDALNAKITYENDINEMKNRKNGGEK